jgi:hypothetical protein
MNKWLSITLGAEIGCALNANGNASCFYYSELGQLPTPLQVPSHRYSKVATGATHACGILDQDGVPGRYRGDIEWFVHISLSLSGGFAQR